MTLLPQGAMAKTIWSFTSSRVACVHRVGEVHDVMHEGQKIISVSYRSLEVYLAIALVYFVLTGTVTLVLRHFEQRLRQGGLVR